MGAVYVQDHGQLGLADLAFELLEVVVLGAAHHLFLHLEMDPLG